MEIEGVPEKNHFWPSVSLYLSNHGGGAVGKSVRLPSERLGVRIPAATDQSRKNR